MLPLRSRHLADILAGRYGYRIGLEPSSKLVANGDIAGMHQLLPVLFRELQPSYAFARFRRGRVPSPIAFASLLRFFA